jgi:hypothetical protein
MMQSDIVALLNETWGERGLTGDNDLKSAEDVEEFRKSAEADDKPGDGLGS